MVPKSCPANPRTEWALRGAGPVTFSLTAVRAARAARGTLWPLAPPPCQVGSKPAGRGSFERHTETPAAGRGLNWSRRGQGQPFKLSSGPCRLHLKSFCDGRRPTDVLRWNNPSLYSKYDAQGVDIWVGSQDPETIDPQSVTDACVISSSKVER